MAQLLVATRATGWRRPRRVRCTCAVRGLLPDAAQMALGLKMHLYSHTVRLAPGSAWADAGSLLTTAQVALQGCQAMGRSHAHKPVVRPT